MTKLKKNFFGCVNKNEELRKYGVSIDYNRHMGISKNPSFENTVTYFRSFPTVIM